MVSKLPHLPNMFFRRKLGKEQGEISMDAEMIRLLFALDENKPMGQIAKEIGMDLGKVHDILLKLIRFDLVETVGSGVAFLSAAFMAQVKKELIKAIGPIGEFLIEDVAEDMGLPLDQIPIHKAPELISELAQEIPEEESRLMFKRAVISMLPK